MLGGRDRIVFTRSAVAYILSVQACKKHTYC